MKDLLKMQKYEKTTMKMCLEDINNGYKEVLDKQVLKNEDNGMIRVNMGVLYRANPEIQSKIITELITVRESKLKDSLAFNYLTELIKHPVHIAFIMAKWKRVKLFFIIRNIMYMFFLFLYALFVYLTTMRSFPAPYLCEGQISEENKFNCIKHWYATDWSLVILVFILVICIFGAVKQGLKFREQLVATVASGDPNIEKTETYIKTVNIVVLLLVVVVLTMAISVHRHRITESPDLGLRSFLNEWENGFSVIEVLFLLFAMALCIKEVLSEKFIFSAIYFCVREGFNLEYIRQSLFYHLHPRKLLEWISLMSAFVAMIYKEVEIKDNKNEWFAWFISMGMSSGWMAFAMNTPESCSTFLGKFIEIKYNIIKKIYSYLVTINLAITGFSLGLWILNHKLSNKDDHLYGPFHFVTTSITMSMGEFGFREGFQEAFHVYSIATVFFMNLIFFIYGVIIIIMFNFFLDSIYNYHERMQKINVENLVFMAKYINNIETLIYEDKVLTLIMSWNKYVKSFFRGLIHLSQNYWGKYCSNKLCSKDNKNNFYIEQYFEDDTLIEELEKIILSHGATETGNRNNKNLIKNWKQCIKKGIHDSKTADKMITSIMELHDVEDSLNMAKAAVNYVRKTIPSGLCSILDLEIAVVTSQSELCPNYLAHNNPEIQLNEDVMDILDENWESVVENLLSFYSRPIIHAIKTLHGSNNKTSALEAYNQINRFISMGIITRGKFWNTMKKISWGLSFSKSCQIIDNLEEDFYSLYDVILEEDLPQNKLEKDTVMQRIECGLNRVKEDHILQEWLLKKYKADLVAYDKKILDEEINPNWKSMDIYVCNIFFGGKTHCIIKIKVSNTCTIPTHMNNLIKIAIENIDAFIHKKIKVEKPRTWGGGELTLKIQWGSFFQRQKDENKVINLLSEILRTIPERMKDDDYKEKLRHELTVVHDMSPVSADQLIQQFENIPLCEVDITEMDIELTHGIPNKMKKLHSNIPLWPYMRRKLNDIDDHQVSTGFREQCAIKGLPASLKYELISNLDIFRQDKEIHEKIYKQVGGSSEPFFDIFKEYEQNGGTFSGWISALESCRDQPQYAGQNAFKDDDERKEIFNIIIGDTMKIYKKWYKRWEVKYKQLPKLITNFEEFSKYLADHRLSSFPKMNREILIQKLEVCDQIWIWRDKLGGYAHVCLYTGEFYDKTKREKNHCLIHVHQNKLFATHKGIGVIKEDRLENVIKPNDKCFIIRKDNLTADERNKIRDRAYACVNPSKKEISFDYNGFSGNCESCVNAFYGIWEDENTSQQGLIVSNTNNHKQQKLAGLILALKTGSDEDLRNKIKRRLDEENLS